MPINNRASVQFPPGLEKSIRAAAAKAGLPLRTYMSNLVARGFYAEEHQEIASRIEAIEWAMVASQNTSRAGAGEVINPAIPQPVLRILAEIFSRVQHAAGQFENIDQIKVSQLAEKTLIGLVNSINERGHK
jgi:hypothetical protein